MVDLKSKKALIVDNGVFFELALKIASHFGHSYFYSTWEAGYPHINKSLIGSEWKNGEKLNTFDGVSFERVECMFDYIDEVDIIIFLDIYDGDLQQFLVEKGYKVFGCMKGEELELERWDTKNFFRKRGMDVQPIKRIIGLDALREELKKVKNKWIKISKFRAVFETFHHIDYKLSEPLLDKMAWTLGPMAKVTEFIVEDHIDALVEEGMDAYTVDGKYPNAMFGGVEIKDTSFAGMFIPYSELSDGLKKVNDQLSPILKKYGYRGFMSTEVRTTKDGKHYLIDPCTRAPSPPSELYQEVYDNLGEIVWGAAHGELVNPKANARYGLEVMINSEWFMEGHQSVYFPPEIRRWVKLKNLMKVDDHYYCLNIDGHNCIGGLIATGNSFEECKKKIEQMAPLIEGQGISINPGSVDEAISEYKKTMKLSK